MIWSKHDWLIRRWKVKLVWTQQPQLCLHSEFFIFFNFIISMQKSSWEVFYRPINFKWNIYTLSFHWVFNIIHDCWQKWQLAVVNHRFTHPHTQRGQRVFIDKQLCASGRDSFTSSLSAKGRNESFCICWWPPLRVGQCEVDEWQLCLTILSLKQRIPVLDAVRQEGMIWNLRF